MASITSMSTATITNNSSRLTEAQQKLLESAPRKGSITSVSTAVINKNPRLTEAQQKMLESAKAKLGHLTPAMARRLADLFEHARK